MTGFVVVWDSNNLPVQREMDLLYHPTPKSPPQPSPQKIKFLLSLLENLLTDEDGDKLPKLDKSLLEETVLETYRKHSGSGNCPKLGDLSDTLLESEHSALRNFSKMLYLQQLPTQTIALRSWRALGQCLRWNGSIPAEFREPQEIGK